MHTDTFNNYLIGKKILSGLQAKQELLEAEHNNISFIAHLIKKKILSYKTIAENTAKYFGLPLINLQNYNITDMLTTILDKNIIAEYKILPLKKENNYLHLAVSDPTQTQIFNEIKFKTNLNIKLKIAEYDQLTKLISAVIHEQRFEHFNSEDAHIISFVDQIFSEAFGKKASDIHFEPYENSYRIRFRIDGVLSQVTHPDKKIANRLAVRLKVMSGLNISEKRLPQDGRFRVTIHKQAYDCRISVCPTSFGEKIVVRLLNPSAKLLNINELGLEGQQQKIFLNAINSPQGMILVTGPTGSGKTISLYAALNELNSIDKNISSVEDPIEINLPGVNQVNINPKIGLNFTIVLRAFLRQDPDIIMVGEIRDPETAETAIKAAQTGHLVLSTLHTNSTAESITRLINMGISTFNIDNSINLIIAQRLVRKLCHDEYYGRTGIFEVMPISETINRLILQHASAAEIHNQACAEGMLTLHEAALNKVQRGITSIEEIKRVL